MDFSELNGMVAEVIQRVSVPFHFYQYELEETDGTLELSLFEERVHLLDKPELISAIAIDDSEVRGLKWVLDSGVMLDPIRYTAELELFYLVVLYLYKMSLLKMPMTIEAYLTTVLNKEIRNWRDLILYILKINGVKYTITDESSVSFWDYVIQYQDGKLSISGEVDFSVDVVSPLELFEYVIRSLVMVANYKDEPLFVYEPAVEEEIADPAADIDETFDDSFEEDFEVEDTGLDEFGTEDLEETDEDADSTEDELIDEEL